MSIASTEAKPQVVSNNLSFREAFDSPIEQSSRPLVFIYGWLVAKAKHIHKYGDFYLGKGFDVLHIKVSPDQLLWPTRAQGVVEQALEFAAETKRETQPILAHGFSVGAYLYGETLVKINQMPSFKDMAARIKGQIYDSPVDFNGIPYGVSNAVTKNPLLQKTMQYSIEGYLSLFKKNVMAHYLLSSETSKLNAMKIPSMFLYSEADVVGDHVWTKELIDEWRNKNILVEAMCWKESMHVGHFVKYPVEYITMLNMFLDTIGLTTTEVPIKEEEKIIERQNMY